MVKFFVPPDDNGRDQDPLDYLYERMLEQQHEIDRLALALRMKLNDDRMTLSPFTHVHKAQIIGDDGRAIELGSAPKPAVVTSVPMENTLDLVRLITPARNPDDYLPHPTIAKSATVEVVPDPPSFAEFDGLIAALKSPKNANPPPVIEVVQEPLIINDQWAATLDELNNGTQHLFLTGGAGTGKSTLTNKWLSETYRNVAVTASTGVAALRVHGETLHRFFHFPTHALDEEDTPDLRERDIQKIKYLDTLVIDEISMVRADLMDAIECTLRKYGPEPGMPFGGVRLVMVGDLYQLPPVVADKAKGKPLESFLMAHYGTSKPFFFHAHCWRERRPKIIELTTIFRQSDPAFVGALNAIRKGTLSTDDLILLNGRTNSGFQTPVGEVWMRIVTTNAKAKEANEIMVQQLPGAERTFSADIRDDFGDDLPTDEYLTLKPGAAVMFIKNDKDHHWVNGTMARVKEVNPFLLVEVNGIECMITREKWESIEYQYDKATKKLKKTTRGSFSQIPLKIAAAATIHKVQGTTLEHAILDLGTGTFDDGMLYVGLSRLTSLEGLVLARDIRLSDLRTNKEVQRFMTGLEIAKPASLMF